MNGDESQTTIVDKSHTNKDLLQPKHRVTFSSDVEEYAEAYDDDIDSVDVQYKDEEEIDREVAEIIESDHKTSPLSIENDKMDGLMKFMTIEENIVANDERCATDDESDIIKSDDECHGGIAVKSKPIDQSAHKAIDKKSDIIETTNKVSGNSLPCRVCAKTESTHSSSKRPTSSKPIGTKQYKTDKSRCKNRIASASASTSTSQRNVDPSNDLFKIHLNVRTCCESKYLDNNRLPRYNGYNSQYGLSKDQMEQRKLNHQKFMEQRTRRNREILRAKEEIAYLNEQAFRQWLIRKNHSARSKYKNMYDL